MYSSEALHRKAAREQGFTLVELLVATVVSMLVLGGAVAVTSQIQSGYRRQVEAAAAEQEGRYALDWLSKLIRAAGNNPYNVASSDCPGAGTVFEAVRFDPDGDGVNDDIRLQTDSYPPDGQVGGTTGTCDQANEDVTISFDPANKSITFFDNNLLGVATLRTDAVIQDLRFIYRDSNHQGLPDFAEPAPANVFYVETQVTVATKTADPSTGLPVTRTLTSEVRIRGRAF